jgi:hypothetical protein
MLTRSQVETGLLGLLLGLLVLAVQIVVVFAFTGYCDENVFPGSSRDTVCSTADDGGYLVALVLPAASVFLAGVVGAGLNRRGLVVWVFVAALLVGTTVPLVTALLAHNR